VDAVSVTVSAGVVHVVDVYVLRGTGPSMQVLRLRRASGQRCAGAWESVHGRREPGETPVQAALRELQEETGFVPLRFYSLSRIEQFWLHTAEAMAIAPVFAAFVADDAAPVLGPEHDAWEWRSAHDGADFAWPRENRALADAIHLLGSGSAGPLEDVLRVC
jgi:8-oxo-dGTP pyrophosphatase MutT (NUDIX family)